jgi:hypothetical protein
MVENTPTLVADWLWAALMSSPPAADRMILDRLRYDERMAALWDQNEAGGWPPQSQVALIKSAAEFGSPTFLAALLEKPERRIDLSPAQWMLWATANMLLTVIKRYSGEAARLAAGADLATADADIDPTPLDDLQARLQAFADRAHGEAEALRCRFDHLSPPSRRGQGNPMRLAYRKALDDALVTLPDVTLTQEQRDRIVALLTSVVFAQDVEAETVARTRQRQHKRNRPRSPDNLG